MENIANGFDQLGTGIIQFLYLMVGWLEAYYLLPGSLILELVGISIAVPGGMQVANVALSTFVWWSTYKWLRNRLRPKTPQA